MKLYEQSGVNLNEANKLHSALKNELNLSSFAGENSFGKLNLVTCCDGIGSKIIPLYEKEKFKTIAADVVAANLNDMVCSGATAVGFIDYIAVNKLESAKIATIVKSISEELEKCNCKLLGGETSEIGELITKNNIDISGFAVGINENKNFSKENIASGDIVVGLVSSGIHANGFSLIRKLKRENALTEKEFEKCLAPTFIYYNTVKKLINAGLVKSCANITGGGILSNLSRAVPEKYSIELNFDKIPPQEIFVKLKEICGDEFYEVFNAGVGFCLVAEEKNFEEIKNIASVFSPFVFGKIEEKK